VATFHDTLQAVQDGRYDDAAWGMLNSAWHRQVGTRAAILADIMRTGVWPA
jgi:lysozyme